MPVSPFASIGNDRGIHRKNGARCPRTVPIEGSNHIARRLPWTVGMLRGTWPAILAFTNKRRRPALGLEANDMLNLRTRSTA